MSESITVCFEGEREMNLIAEGDHRARTEEVDLKPGRESKEDYLNNQFRIIEGPQENRCAFGRISLAKGSRWKLKRFFKALGLPNVGEVTIELDQILGRELIITIAHNNFQGKIVEEVVDFKSVNAR